MNRQEIFNKVVAHSRQMTKRSVRLSGENEDFCCYRTEDGNKCFIGCLIPDQEYDPSIEGCSAGSLQIFAELKGSDKLWLSHLQSIHDFFFNKREEKLKEFSEEYNLRMPE